MGLIMNKIIEFIISILDTILPTLGLSEEFYIQFDNAMVWVVDLISGANFFIPLDIAITCFFVTIAVDKFSFFMKIGKWVLRTITNIIPGT